MSWIRGWIAPACLLLSCGGPVWALTPDEASFRALVEKEIAATKPQAFMAATDGGYVFHGTSLERARSIAEHDIVGSSANIDIPGFYTISSYSRALEYARGRANLDGDVPIVIMGRIARPERLRALLSTSEIQAHPFYRRLLGGNGNHNAAWSYMRDTFKLDLVIEGFYLVFFNKKAAGLPESEKDLARMLDKQLKLREVINESYILGDLSSHEMAREARPHLKCAVDLGK